MTLTLDPTNLMKRAARDEGWTDANKAAAADGLRVLEASGVTLVERHEQAGASPFLTTDHPFYPADLADRDSQPTLRALGKLRELVAGASRT